MKCGIIICINGNEAGHARQNYGNFLQVKAKRGREGQDAQKL